MTSSTVRVHVDIEFDYNIWTFLCPKTALNDFVQHSQHFPNYLLMTPKDEF